MGLRSPGRAQKAGFSLTLSLGLVLAGAAQARHGGGEFGPHHFHGAHIVTYTDNQAMTGTPGWMRLAAQSPVVYPGAPQVFLEGPRPAYLMSYAEEVVHALGLNGGDTSFVAFHGSSEGLSIRPDFSGRRPMLALAWRLGS